MDVLTNASTAVACRSPRQFFFSLKLRRERRTMKLLVVLLGLAIAAVSKQVGINIY